MIRTAMTIIMSLFIVYGVLCLLLYFFQRSLIYFPQPETKVDRTDVINIAVDSINLNIIAAQCHNTGAIIYFGGNAENVGLSIPSLLAAFPDKAIYAMHYRGYGGSEGVPSEEALVKDALFLLDHIKKSHSDIIVIGRSLGSGIATQLANKRQVHRLILITPFDSIQNIATGRFPFFPIHLLLKDKFESWKYAQNIFTPTTIIIAEFDEVIPLRNSKNLLASFPPGIAKLIVIPNTGHNSISSNREYISALRNQKI
ncbi:MAG: hypothetical protein B0W54_08375 [Cellvibrio sp. 79]|nr:MAG: hypothetical protein B0W54_08375 [Cellvibrio sp. 79]